MRLYEFTNAEEQLKLLQLIFDNTFSTIRQQAEQQARVKAEKSRVAKLKPKRSTKTFPSIKVVSSPKPPTKPSKPTVNPTQPPAKSSQPSTNLSSLPTQPQANSPTTFPNKTLAPKAISPIKPIPPIKPIGPSKYPIKSKINKSKNSLEDEKEDSN
jgi:hypothetical protein